MQTKYQHVYLRSCWEEEFDSEWLDSLAISGCLCQGLLNLYVMHDRKVTEKLFLCGTNLTMIKRLQRDVYSLKPIK